MQANNGIFLLINPNAGNTQSAALEKYAYEECEKQERKLVVYKLVRDEDVGALLSKAQKEGCSVFAVAGGDGSQSLVAHHLVNSSISLGIIPTGTANVLAKELAIPLDTKRAFDLILAGKSKRRIDVMKIHDRFCISHLSIGTYAQMALEVDDNAKKIWGRGAYLKPILKMFWTRPYWDFSVCIDGQKQEVKVSSILLANTGHFGLFGLRWNECSMPDDGVLEVYFVHAHTFCEYIILFWELLFKRQEKSKYLTQAKVTQKFEIADTFRLPIRGDGDVIPSPHFFVEVVRGAVAVLVAEEQTHE